MVAETLGCKSWSFEGRVWVMALLSAGLGWCSLAVPTCAVEPPVGFGFLRRSTSFSTDPTQMRLQAEDGPFVILATTFEGENAQQQATDLAAELREKFKLKAYVHPRQTNSPDVMYGLKLDPQGNQLPMRYRQPDRGQAYAVLVGDFDSMDQPKTRKALDLVKHAHPESLGGSGAKAADTTSAIKQYRDTLFANLGGADKKEAGPLRSAFVTRNPLLPKDYFQPPTVDKTVAQWNTGPYSLLECKKRYTVCVTTLRGDERYLTGTSQKVAEEGGSEALMRAAEMVERGARVLREQGFEAYTFHDRYASHITIGGFAELGATTEDGQFYYSPNIMRIMQLFGGTGDKMYSDPRTGTKAAEAKTLLNVDFIDVKKIAELSTGDRKQRVQAAKDFSVPFDLEPRPMAVPRPETNRIYGGSLLGR
jgi:hypothetical protein